MRYCKAYLEFGRSVVWSVLVFYYSAIAVSQEPPETIITFEFADYFLHGHLLQFCVIDSKCWEATDGYERGIGVLEEKKEQNCDTEYADTYKLFFTSG